MGVKLPRCKRGRCKRIARVAGWCKTHATQEADRRFSAWVRGYGGCYGKTEFWQGPEIKCAGHLQCCHLFSRRYRNVVMTINKKDHRCLFFFPEICGSYEGDVKLSQKCI